jgi:16S rRNA (cytidine1402-2'-O)-methyltransferase
VTQSSKQIRDGAERALEAGLYLVATPIGNAEDITLRALRILRDADAVYCEDTRVTRKLLSLHGQDRRLIPYHDHSDAKDRSEILERLAGGECVALVSDAGTPLVSDPGFKLVREAVAAGFRVLPIPGASSLLAAVSISALPPDRFLFAGFLPPKAAARARAIADLATVDATLVFLEGASRVPDTLADLAHALGSRPAVVARELTKKFEEAVRGPLPELAARYAQEGPPKGEVVLVVGPPDPAAQVEEAEAALDDALRDAMANDTLRKAVDRVTARLGLPRKQVYARALALKDGDA